MSVKLTIEFPNKKYRDEFASWLSNAGEQDFNAQITEYNTRGPKDPLAFIYPSSSTVRTEIYEEESGDSDE